MIGNNAILSVIIAIVAVIIGFESAMAMEQSPGKTMSIVQSAETSVPPSITYIATTVVVTTVYVYPTSTSTTGGSTVMSSGTSSSTSSSSTTSSLSTSITAKSTTMYSTTFSSQSLSMSSIMSFSSAIISTSLLISSSLNTSSTSSTSSHPSMATLTSLPEHAVNSPTIFSSASATTHGGEGMTTNPASENTTNVAASDSNGTSSNNGLSSGALTAVVTVGVAVFLVAGFIVGTFVVSRSKSTKRAKLTSAAATQSHSTNQPMPPLIQQHPPAPPLVFAGGSVALAGAPLVARSSSSSSSLGSLPLHSATAYHPRQTSVPTTSMANSPARVSIGCGAGAGGLGTTGGGGGLGSSRTSVVEKMSEPELWQTLRSMPGVERIMSRHQHRLSSQHPESSPRPLSGAVGRALSNENTKIRVASVPLLTLADSQTGNREEQIGSVAAVAGDTKDAKKTGDLAVSSESKELFGGTGPSHSIEPYQQQPQMEVKGASPTNHEFLTVGHDKPNPAAMMSTTKFAQPQKFIGTYMPAGYGDPGFVPPLILSVPPINTDGTPFVPSVRISNRHLLVPNTRHLAIFPFRPHLPDEMLVNIGDQIVISELFADGWAKGWNETSQKWGLFPLEAVLGIPVRSL